MAWFADWWRRMRPWASLGQRGESAAARHLRHLGYRILARGERNRLGEIDIVALDGRTIVFAEVKTRASQEAGHPVEAVDRDKQRRLTRLALAWLQRHKLLDQPCRFDVVAATWPADSRQPVIEHFINAFEATGCDGMHA